MIKVLVGPSGSGKTTIANYMQSNLGYKKPVTCTTRMPRKGEIDGVSYHFLTEEEFLTGIKNGEFVEHTIYSGHFYGLKFADINPEVNTVIVMDINGAKAIKGKFPNAETIFIDRDKKSILKAIIERTCSSDEKVERILQLEEDYKSMPLCDTVLINNKPVEELHL